MVRSPNSTRRRCAKPRTRSYHTALAPTSDTEKSRWPLPKDQGTSIYVFSPMPARQPRKEPGALEETGCLGRKRAGGLNTKAALTPNRTDDTVTRRRRRPRTTGDHCPAVTLGARWAVGAGRRARPSRRYMLHPVVAPWALAKLWFNRYSTLTAEAGRCPRRGPVASPHGPEPVPSKCQATP
jgi:hypothetical protein